MIALAIDQLIIIDFSGAAVVGKADARKDNRTVSWYVPVYHGIPVPVRTQLQLHVVGRHVPDLEQRSFSIRIRKTRDWPSTESVVPIKSNSRLRSTCDCFEIELHYYSMEDIYPFQVKYLLSKLLVRKSIASVHACIDQVSETIHVELWFMQGVEL